MSERVEEIRAGAGLKLLEKTLADLEEASGDSTLWDDRAKAQQTLQALTDVKEKIKLLNDFKSQVFISIYRNSQSIDSELLLVKKTYLDDKTSLPLKCLNQHMLQVEDAETIVNLTEEMDSIDTALVEEAASIIKELRKSIDRFELTQLLSGPYDKEGAVITISAGAGGTDAQVMPLLV